MKPFIASIFALFLFAMGCGIYVAYHNAEGLVETNYYERGNGWFRTKEQEERLGFSVRKPDSLSAGRNAVRFVLTEHGQPLQQATVKLFVGNVSTPVHDATATMRETSPGVYEADALIPSKGKWLLRMDLAATELKTSRSWFFDVR